METKQEILARINELEMFYILAFNDNSRGQGEYLENRVKELKAKAESAEEDISSAVLRSHIAVCKAKGMGMKDAYGQDPALYYSAAISAEGGELLNKLIRGLRNGNDPEVSRNSVISELPDIVIYSHVLSYVLDLDLPKLVADKVEVVIQRAESGYYGGKLPGKT